MNGLSEAQGLVIQEAQAMQLPVLISNVGGMSEGILEGVSGFVLSQNDLYGFIDKIELLGRDFKLRKKMGDESRRLVEQKYDLQLLNESLLNLYNNDKNLGLHN